MPANETWGTLAGIDIDREVLGYVASRKVVVPEGASWWTSCRKRAADRLVEEGRLEHVTGPMGSGYRVPS